MRSPQAPNFFQFPAPIFSFSSRRRERTGQPTDDDRSSGGRRWSFPKGPRALANDGQRRQKLARRRASKLRPRVEHAPTTCRAREENHAALLALRDRWTTRRPCILQIRAPVIPCRTGLTLRCLLAQCVLRGLVARGAERENGKMNSIVSFFRLCAAGTILVVAACGSSSNSNCNAMASSGGLGGGLGGGATGGSCSGSPMGCAASATDGACIAAVKASCCNQYMACVADNICVTCLNDGCQNEDQTTQTFLTCGCNLAACSAEPQCQ